MVSSKPTRIGPEGAKAGTNKPSKIRLCGWPKVLSHYKRRCVLTGMTDHASGPTYFSSHDRRRLATTLSRTSDLRLFRRVQAVLRVAEGDPIRSVARSLRVGGRSVQRWVAVYGCRRQPEDLLDARRSGRPRAAGKLDQAALAQGAGPRPTCPGLPRHDLDHAVADD